MKHKSLTAVLVAVILFILTCLTVVFVADYYTRYGNLFSNALYETTGRLALSGTKALDAESVQLGVERMKALTEFTVTSADDMSGSFYGSYGYTLPDTTQSAAAGRDIQAPAPDSEDAQSAVSSDTTQTPAASSARDPKIIYVVYSKGGGN